MSESPTALYRFFASTGELLYVGISLDLSTRIRSHRGEKPGWNQVARIELAWYDVRAEAAAAELEAIRTEGPLWNKSGTDRRWSRDPNYIVLANWMTEQIAIGAWSPGQEVPDAVLFAQQNPHLGVETIRRSMRIMVDRGALLRRGRRLFVSGEQNVDVETRAA